MCDMKCQSLKGDEEEDDEKRDEGMPPYPEGAQALIAVADTAREQFKEAERELRDVEKEVRELNKFIDTDLGSAMEFGPLYEQCYELTDREYTYKLCAFNKVTQKSKDGGRESSLGTWVSWNGPPGDHYSGMLFDDGEGCWNGPKRSTKVSVACGFEEAVLSASEPNRCEYAMKFVTPAVCQPSSPRASTTEPGVDVPKHHQEL